jgi:hypothetical protein
MNFHQAIGDQQVQRLARNFLGRIAKRFLGGFIEDDDLMILIHRDDRFRRMFENVGG